MKKAVAYVVTGTNQGSNVLEEIYESLYRICEEEGASLVAIFQDLNYKNWFLRDDAPGAEAFMKYVIDNESDVDVVIFPRTDSDNGVQHGLWDSLFDPYDLYGESHAKVNALSYPVFNQKQLHISEDGLPF